MTATANRPTCGPPPLHPAALAHAQSRSATDPQRSVPRNRSLSVTGHGALLVAASGILVAAHAGRRARTGARSSSRGERQTHGALPNRLHAVQPLDRQITRIANSGCQNRPDAVVQADWRSLTSAYAREASSACRPRGKLTSCPESDDLRVLFSPATNHRHGKYSIWTRAKLSPSQAEGRLP